MLESEIIPLLQRLKDRNLDEVTMARVLSQMDISEKKLGNFIAAIRPTYNSDLKYVSTLAPQIISFISAIRDSADHSLKRGWRAYTRGEEYPILSFILKDLNKMGGLSQEVQLQLMDYAIKAGLQLTADSIDVSRSKWLFEQIKIEKISSLSRFEVSNIDVSRYELFFEQSNFEQIKSFPPAFQKKIFELHFNNVTDTTLPIGHNIELTQNILGQIKPKHLTEQQKQTYIEYLAQNLDQICEDIYTNSEIRNICNLAESKEDLKKINDEYSKQHIGGKIKYAFLQLYYNILIARVNDQVESAKPAQDQKLKTNIDDSQYKWLEEDPYYKAIAQQIDLNKFEDAKAILSVVVNMHHFELLGKKLTTIEQQNKDFKVSDSDAYEKYEAEIRILETQREEIKTNTRDIINDSKWPLGTDFVISIAQYQHKFEGCSHGQEFSILDNLAMGFYICNQSNTQSNRQEEFKLINCNITLLKVCKEVELSSEDTDKILVLFNNTIQNNRIQEGHRIEEDYESIHSILTKHKDNLTEEQKVEIEILDKLLNQLLLKGQTELKSFDLEQPIEFDKNTIWDLIVQCAQFKKFAGNVESGLSDTL